MARYTYIKGAPRPTLAEAKAMLAERDWTPSEGSWEDADRVYAFAVESYPGTYGGTAASVAWAHGNLDVAPRRPAGVRFV